MARKNYNDIEELEQALVSANNAIDHYPDGFLVTTYWMTIYMRMFGTFPHCIYVQNDGKYLNLKIDDIDNFDDEDFDFDEECRTRKFMTFNHIKVMTTMLNVIRKYEGRCICRRFDETPIIVTNDFIMYYNYYHSRMVILSDHEYLTDEMMSLIEDRKKTDPSRIFSYVIRTDHGFTTRDLKIKHRDVDLALMYNDDLPHEKIMEFLSGSGSGLLMLHGEPGTGKTTYIRHLMESFGDNKFLVIDSSVFGYITDSSFIDMLMSYRNCVIILEDCEEMVTENRNRNVGTLLNLTDGILGDSFNFKFICTFNTEIKNIDKALMRNGRMKVRYEFKKLSASKTKRLCESLGYEPDRGKEMTLANIFNHDDNGAVRERKRVGFIDSDDITMNRSHELGMNMHNFKAGDQN